jgi:PDZ domain-containing protein
LRRICCWLDRIGMIIAFLFIIFGELIWLPDPIRLSHNTYWIQFMDELVYLGILTPLAWSISAVIALIHLWKNRENTNHSLRLLALVRIATLISSMMVIYGIIWALNHLLWIIAALAFAWLMTLLGIQVEEWILIRKLPRKNLKLLAASIVLLMILLWPTSYLVTYPGLTLNLNQYAQVESGQSNDEIAGVLIFERPAFPIDWLYAKVFSHYEFEKRQKTDLSLGAQLQEVRTEQIDANQIASAVAFKKVGKGRGAISHGVRVIGISKGSAAFEQLNLGDIIIQANNHNITTTNELINDIKQTKPGDTIELSFLRNKAYKSIVLKTKADQIDPTKPVLGIQITDEVQLDLPLTVKFHPYLLYLGGPSHGAMLTLALIDQLTPGGVTYGNRVAGTGTIDSQGVVGAIGGIRQKAFSVERAGFDVFFVPAAQANEARQGSSPLNIVPVQTIDDILVWLKEHPKG